ncbi:hypothetical protein MYP_3154 [Sporocytophaga myxococcoides]|uniref:Uncharacterized protein n=1 Tax=Sporocytophaga myxococcoides TaxID=153721 RepID=A0A098LG28_9BACT|nr:hypothetical protein MYP_3154 [Sporocytophaga myxococcoides]
MAFGFLFGFYLFFIIINDKILFDDNFIYSQFSLFLKCNFLHNFNSGDIQFFEMPI